MYTCYDSLSNAGEIEICLEVSQLHHMMKRAWPENSCWTPSEQVWTKLLLGRKGMSVLKLVLELRSTSMPVAVCMWKTKQHKIPIDLYWSSL